MNDGPQIIFQGSKNVLVVKLFLGFGTLWMCIHKCIVCIVHNHNLLNPAITVIKTF